jgi:hypothetical protein
MNIIDKIKALWAVKKAVDGIQEAQMKIGWKTSEFWFAVMSQLVPVMLAVWGFIPATVMTQIMTTTGILAGVYTLARSIVKASASKNDDVVFNRIVGIIKPIADKLGIPIEPIE